MGRPRKVVEVQAQAIEQTETEQVINEPEIVAEISEPIIDKTKEDKFALEKRIKELEIKLQEKNNEGGIDELLKSPTFGTKLYLHLLMETLVDPNNPLKNIPVTALVSCFPNAVDPSEIDPNTKKPRLLCPDINIDRSLGDKIRNTDADSIDYGIGFDGKPRKINLKVEHKGKIMRAKEAIRLLQIDYLKRKKEGDDLHKLEMDKISKASA